MSASAPLVTLTDPLSLAAEAYRTLRMNLQFADGRDEFPRSVLLTSVGEPDHTAITAANLGIALAQVGHHVIVVDANLRGPSLHELFGAENDSGLGTLLTSDEISPESVLRPTTVDGLSLLAAGPAVERPPDMLGSRRMDTILEALASAADIVLLACPRVMAMTDAAALASKVEGVVLVTVSGKTHRDGARAAIQRLRRMRANILGAVLTDVPRHYIENQYSADMGTS